MHRIKILFGFIFGVISLEQSNASEFRALWVDAFGPGFQTTNEVKKLVSDCRKYNFNAVIVQMRRRGDAFYFPKVPNPDPRTVALTNEPKLDCLAEVIRECHTGTPRIEVHCWIVSHFIWAWKKPPPQRKHVFNLHPEYLTKDALGQKLFGDRYYLDPGNPDANQSIHDVVTDIVNRYDIDGLHWDYVRYPSRDSGYNEAAIKRYNEEFGLKGEPKPDDPKFCEWRRRQVTDFLRWVDADMWAIKPNLVISASVFANYTDSSEHRFADWEDWNKEGITDICMPMNFSADNKNVFNVRTDDAVKRQGTRLAYIGQGGYMNSKENTVKQLKYIQDKNLSGYVFYDYRHTASGKTNQTETFNYLKENYQPTWIETPALPWKQTRGIIKGTVRNGSKAVYNATVTINTKPPKALRTEPHGNYAFFNLPPGKYTISASVSEEKKSKEKEVVASKVAVADLVLEK